MVAGFVLAVGAQLDLKGQANWGWGEGGLAVLTPSYHWGQTFSLEEWSRALWPAHPL